MKYKFRNLVDLNILQNIMDKFYELTGITNAIVDVDLEIIITSGWQDICQNFHRVNPHTGCRCRQSDEYINTRVGYGYIIYQCKNGLMEAVTPIVVNEDHVATIFLGQWLEAQPDENYFREQAQQFGFDVEEYLLALNKIPIVTRDKVESSMKFLAQLAEILSDLGLKQLEHEETEASLRKLNEDLGNMLTERTTDLSELFTRHDLTRRTQLEREIMRLDRLNLIGEMAANLAHEIRNPLTTVRGFLQLFLINQDFHGYNENLKLMIEEVDRVNAIISEYLSLAKDKALNRTANNLNDILNSILPLIYFTTVKQDIRVILKFGNIRDCLLDEKEIGQLILNLVRNAIEAMPAGGALTITTYMDNNIVVLAVKDEGSGITPKVQEKLGIPFFTTKETGTGLGLAVCYNIAARHNAVINFETGAAGTTFFVHFRELIN